MGLLEIYKKSIDLIKNHIIDSLLYGIIFYILWILLFLIPLLGAIIFSYFYPRLSKWYYTKVTGDNINPDYKTSSKSLLIPTLLASIGITIIFALLISILMNLPLTLTNMLNTSNLQQLILTGLSNSHILTYALVDMIVSIILLMIGGIAWLLLLYSIYGSILGKVNKFSIYFEKSLILLGYILLYTIIASVILFIIYIIYALAISISYGMLIFFFLLTIFVVPTVTLIALLKAKEL